MSLAISNDGMIKVVGKFVDKKTGCIILSLDESVEDSFANEQLDVLVSRATLNNWSDAIEKLEYPIECGEIIRLDTIRKTRLLVDQKFGFK